MNSDHRIKIESTQVWRGEVGPEAPKLLTGDGEGRAFGRKTENVAYDLQFHEEIQVTYECTCGRRFRKGETARDHLERVSENDG